MVTVNTQKEIQLVIYTDGGARGNPGHAGIGVVIYGSDGTVLKEYSEYIGETTNNQAEYRAVIKAFELAKEFKPAGIQFFLDSELVVKQLNGAYKVKDKDLGLLYIKVHNARQQYKKVTFTHIPRVKNKEADRLVNKAIDRKLKMKN